MNKVLVFGHKSPDTDTVTSAVVMANLENKLGIDAKACVLGKLNKETERHLRTNMQMIFQDPMASLNPRKKVLDLIAQGLDVHKLYQSKEERDEMVFKMLERVGLSRDHAYRYPHQFSGGQRQRIGIARA